MDIWKSSATSDSMQDWGQLTLYQVRAALLDYLLVLRSPLPCRNSEATIAMPAAAAEAMKEYLMPS